jgi:hypothetical protein
VLRRPDHHGLPREPSKLQTVSGVVAAMAVSLAAFIWILTQPAKPTIEPTWPPQSSSPVNISAPTIFGTYAVGQLMFSRLGDWTQDPRYFTVQWQQCNAAGASCADIGGATNRSYTLQNADSGNTVRVGITAHNGFGSTLQYSAVTPVISGGTQNLTPSASGSSQATNSVSTPSFVNGKCGTGGCTVNTGAIFHVNAADSSSAPYGGVCYPVGSCTSSPATISMQIVVARPGNLCGGSSPPAGCSGAAGSATNPRPPVVITWGQTVSGYNDMYNAAANPIAGLGPFIVVEINNTFNPGGNQLPRFPTVQWQTWCYLTGACTNNAGQSFACGTTAQDLCDPIPTVLAVLSAMNCPYTGSGICQGYNTNEVFMLGTSASAIATEDVACDTRTSASFAGVAIVADKFLPPSRINQSAAAQWDTGFPLGPPYGVQTAHMNVQPPNCPELYHPNSTYCVQDCITTSPNTNMSWIFLYGTQDTQNGGCTPSAGNCGGTTWSCMPQSDANDCAGNGAWQSTAPDIWYGGIINDASQFVAPALGCSSTPTNTYSEGLANELDVRIYHTGCTNPNVAVELVRGHCSTNCGANGVSHQPNTWPCGPGSSTPAQGFQYLSTPTISAPVPYCTGGTGQTPIHDDTNPPNGSGLQQIAEAWTFWTTYFP